MESIDLLDLDHYLYAAALVGPISSAVLASFHPRPPPNREGLVRLNRILSEKIWIASDSDEPDTDDESDADN